MTRLYRLLAFTAVFAMAAVGSANANGCLDNGICWQVTPNGDGVNIGFSNLPRAHDYVTQDYNVRGMNGGQVQVEIPPYGTVSAAWGAVVSVQACRHLGVFQHSICTPWSSFKAF